MAIFLGDICQITFRGSAFLQRIILSLHYRVSVVPPPDSDPWAALATILGADGLSGAASVRSEYLKCLPSDYTLDAIRAQWINPIRSAYRQVVYNTSGTYDGTANMSIDAAALTMRTVNSGRNQVATHHIGPVPTEEIDAGLLLNEYTLLISNLGVKMASLITVPDPAMSLTPCIYHPTTHTYTDIKEYIIGKQVRTMNRRTIGYGE